MKKYSLSIIAILMAVGFSAFSSESSTTRESAGQKNFIYTAYPSKTSTDLNNPANYTLTGNDGQDPLQNCSGTGNRCGVNAMDNGTGHPVLSGAQTFPRS